MKQAPLGLGFHRRFLWRGDPSSHAAVVVVDGTEPFCQGTSPQAMFGTSEPKIEAFLARHDQDLVKDATATIHRFRPIDGRLYRRKKHVVRLSAVALDLDVGGKDLGRPGTLTEEAAIDQLRNLSRAASALSSNWGRPPSATV